MSLNLFSCVGLACTIFTFLYIFRSLQFFFHILFPFPLQSLQLALYFLEFLLTLTPPPPSLASLLT
jgi:hypothetical protein